ncbi:unnamed protein product, partial [Rotaria socialis]
NQCPTMNKKIANCRLGYYGLVSINAWESSKTINQLISQDAMMRDSVEEQCLQYYYYFTVYEKLVFGQQVSVLIKSDNETEDEIEIDRLSDIDMIENRWHSRKVTFNSTSTNSTLIFRFEVTATNRTEDPTLNKTIFFALDNVNIYNRNCQHVFEPSVNQTAPFTTVSQSSTTTERHSTEEITQSPSPAKENRLGLILALSLGVSVPVFIMIILGMVIYSTGTKPEIANKDLEFIPLEEAFEARDSDSSIEYISESFDQW